MTKPGRFFIIRSSGGKANARHAVPCLQLSLSLIPISSAGRYRWSTLRYTEFCHAIPFRHPSRRALTSAAINTHPRRGLNGSRFGFRVPLPRSVFCLRIHILHPSRSIRDCCGQLLEDFCPIITVPEAHQR